MEWSLTGVPLPIVLRPLSPWTDDELIAFPRLNQPYKIEKNVDGDITIMTPVGTEGAFANCAWACNSWSWLTKVAEVKQTARMQGGTCRMDPL